MIGRYCLKWELKSGEVADQVRARMQRDLDAWGVRDKLVGMPALEAGGFLQVATKPPAKAPKDNPFGRVSATLALSESDWRHLDLELRSQSGIRLTQDPLLRAFDTSPMPFAAGSVFGNRTMANRLMRANNLPGSARGRGVNVAIIDGGLNQDALGRVTFGGGWSRYTTDRARAELSWHTPGKGKSEHAQMVARNVLAIAPEATIWDVPLLPDTLEGPPSVALAEAFFYYLWRDLRDGIRRAPVPAAALRVGKIRGRPLSPAVLETQTLPSGPWVFVNAWGVLDPSRYDAEEDYITNPGNYFVKDMPRFGRLRNRPVDIIFAAGNCGEPAPVPRCGEGWSGVGRSILGVNAHPNVLTVGTLRVDGVPNGFSAQGPGGLAANWPAADQQGRDRAFQKPDLCAPSGFHEDDDVAVLNTGTSAAAGVMGGVVAALRSHVLAKKLEQPSPTDLRARLRRSAQPGPDQQRPWDPRLGYGIVDMTAALRELDPTF